MNSEGGEERGGGVPVGGDTDEKERAAHPAPLGVLRDKQLPTWRDGHPKGEVEQGGGVADGDTRSTPPPLEAGPEDEDHAPGRSNGGPGPDEMVSYLQAEPMLRQAPVRTQAKVQTAPPGNSSDGGGGEDKTPTEEPGTPFMSEGGFPTTGPSEGGRSYVSVADGEKKGNKADFHLVRLIRENRRRKLAQSGLMSARFQRKKPTELMPRQSFHDQLQVLVGNSTRQIWSPPSVSFGGGSRRQQGILRKNGRPEVGPEDGEPKTDATPSRYIARSPSAPEAAGAPMVEPRPRRRRAAKGGVAPDVRVRFAEQSQLVQSLSETGGSKQQKARRILMLSERSIAVWHMLMVLPLSVESFAVPLRMALTSPGINGQFFVDVGVDVVFMLDALVLACQGQQRESGDVMPNTHIFSSWFSRFRQSIVPCLFIYIAVVLDLSVGWWWLLSLFRLGRLRRLAWYFARMSLDLEVNMRLLKTVQVTLMLFIAIHWVGCSFYFLARLQNFNDSTWVHQLADWNIIEGFSEATASGAEKYSLIAFKGINALTNIGYEGVVPDNWPEMLWAVFVMFLQILVAAYILGTLFHYLVSKDQALEDYGKKLELLKRFMEDRQLQPELRARMLDYFAFRFRKNRANYGASVELPRTLQLRVAETQYAAVVAMSQTGQGAALRGCHQQFMSALLLGLNEVFLMPGEKFITKGDIARDMFFVLGGEVVVTNDKGLPVKTVRGGQDDADGRSILGEVGFIFGVPHSLNAAAKDTGDCTMLVLSKDRYSELIHTYPEQHDIIAKNILAEFGLCEQGKNIAGFTIVDEEAEEVEKTREVLRAAVARRREELLAMLHYVVVNGEASELAPLLRKGADIDATNYDGRAAIHLAAQAGRGRVVEELVKEGANLNVVDRWGRTPLHQAVLMKRSNVVEILLSHGARLKEALPSELCTCAADGNLEQVALLMENGGRPDEGDYDQRTPLHLASASGHQKVVEYLLSRDADPNVKDRWGGTPMEDAIKEGHVLVARLLLEAGAQLPKTGGEKLCTAATRGDLATLQMLYDFGIDLDVSDYDARSAMHLAAAAGRLEVVSFMLAASANPNVRDRWGGTPLDDALRQGHLFCAKLIHANGGETSQSTAVLSGVNIEDVRGQLAQLRARRVAKLRKSRGAGGGSVPAQHDDELEVLVKRMAVVRGLDEMFATRRLAQEVHDLLVDKVAQFKPVVSQLTQMVMNLHTQAMNTVGKQWPRGYKAAYNRMEGASTVATSASNVRWKVAGAKVIDLVEDSKKVVKEKGKATGSDSGSDSNSEAAASMQQSFTTSWGSSLAPLAPKPTAPGAAPEPVPASDEDHAVDLPVASSEDLSLYDELDKAKALSKSVVNDAMDSKEYKRQAKAMARQEYRAKGLAFQRIVVQQIEVLQTGFDVLLACMGPFEDGDTHRVAAHDLGKVLYTMGIRAKRRDVEAIIAEGWSATALRARKNRSSVQGIRARPSAPLTRSINTHGMWACSPTFRRLLQVQCPDPGPELDTATASEYDLCVARAWELIDPDPEAGENDSKGSRLVAVSAPGPDGVDTRADDRKILCKLVARAATITDYLLMSLSDTSAAADTPVVSASTLHAIRPHVSETGMLLYDNMFPPHAEDGPRGDLTPSSFYSLVARWLIAAEGQGEEEEGDDADYDSDNDELARAGGRLCGHGRLPRGIRIPMSTSRMMKIIADRTAAQRYQPAYLRATRGRPEGLRLHETAAFLEAVFPRYRFTNRQVEEMFALFDKNGDGSVTLQEVLRVLRDLGALTDDVAKLDGHPWHVGIVIMPHCKIWGVWDAIMRAFSLFNFVSVPISIAFNNIHYSRGNDTLVLVELIIDVAFIIEVFLRLIRGFVNDKQVPVTNLRDIYLNYAANSMVPDLVAGFPFDILAVGASYETKAFLRVPKLLRLRHVFRHLVEQRASVESQSVSAGLYRLLVMALSMVHIFACLYFYIGSRGAKQWIQRMDGWFGGGEDAAVYKSYLLSFYYVIATFTTNGLVGPMLPNNYEEVIFTFILQFVHITLYAYILGEISGLVMASDDNIAALRAQKATVDNFIRAKGGLNERLRKDIRAHFAEAANNGAGQLNQVMQLMSHSLQVEVARHLSRSILDRVPLFAGVSDGFLDQVAVMMREMVVPPGDVIFETNDASTELYIVRQGVAERFVVIPGEEERKETVVRKGGVVGETEFFFGMRRVFTYRAGEESNLEMYFLRHDTFRTLLMMFPQEERMIAANAIRGFSSLEATIVAASEGGSRGGQSTVSGEQHFENVVGGTVRAIVDDLKKRRHGEAVEQLLLAASMGRCAQVRQDMDAGTGLSVNTANEEGRTPLHVAASEGQVEMVELLLALGADFRLVDQYGSTCLRDALRHEHDGVARVLRAAGAQLGMMDVDAAVLLCEAAAKGDVVTLRRYVDAGVDPNVADYDDRCALHLAASNGHLGAVEYLLSVGVNIEQQDRWGGGPLEDAVRHGHVEVQRLLYAGGARLSSSSMATQMCEAAAAGDVRMVETLVENGVDPCVSDYDGRTALHLAACNEQHAVIKSILDHWRRPSSPRPPALERAGSLARGPGPGTPSTADGHPSMPMSVEDSAASFPEEAAALPSASAGGGGELVPAPGAGDETSVAERRLVELMSPMDVMGGTPLDDARREGQPVALALLVAQGALTGEDIEAAGLRAASLRQQEDIRRADASRRVATVIKSSREHRVRRAAAEVRDSLESGLEGLYNAAFACAKLVDSLTAGNERGEMTGGAAALNEARQGAEEVAKVAAAVQSVKNAPVLSEPRAARDVHALKDRVEQLRPMLTTLSDAATCLKLAFEGLAEEAMAQQKVWEAENGSGMEGT